MTLLKLNKQHEMISTVKRIIDAIGFESGLGPKNGISIITTTINIPNNIKDKQYSRAVLAILNNLIDYCL